MILRLIPFLKSGKGDAQGPKGARNKELKAMISLESFRSDGSFAIHVTDLTKAEEFYSNVLGFMLLDRNSEQLVYETGRFRLFINKDSEATSFIPAFEVNNLDRARAYLLENGCKITKEWAPYRALYCVDPFGFKIDVIERTV